MIQAAVASPPVELAELINEIGRGAHRARDLDADAARALFGAMLDGTIPPLEAGAVLLAYRSKGETVAELTGFIAALGERILHLEAPAERPRPVVLPTYNGVRRLPNLTALLALLLRRYGVPVLLHGPASDEGGDFGRVATAAVLSELGIEPATSVREIEQRLAGEGIAYTRLALLAPRLAGLLAARRSAGLRASAQALARLIEPFGGAGVRVVGVSEGESLPRMRELLVSTRADALLLRGAEGEPFANPRRQPRLEWFDRGVGTVLFEAESGMSAPPPALPAAVDAPTTAAWIAAALAGLQPVPAPILNELACCLYASRRIPTQA